MNTARLAQTATVLGLGACCSLASASVLIHEGGSLLLDTLGVATFDDLGPGDSLVGYEEDGLRLSIDAIQGGGFIPTGFDGSGFYYPSGGGFDLINVMRTDGVAFEALEMNVSSGLGAGSTNFMWIQVWDDGWLVAEFDIDLPQGTLIGITGTFDEVRLGSYFSAAQRDAHEMTNLNVLALDNVAFGTILGPGALDIKPSSCPNSFNRNSNGVLPVALTGSGSFDVSEVDITTIELTRADGVGGSVSPHEGPPGPHTVIDDVATPFPGELCDCHEETSDGFDDLSMKFKSQDVVSALDLDGEDPGALIELCVSGNLNDGTPFGPACDCIRLVPPGSPPGLLAVTSNLPEAWIDLTPPDNAIDQGGFANFVRSYPLTTEVTLTAPSAQLGWVFVGWNVITLGFGSNDPVADNFDTLIRRQSITLPIESALEVVEAVYEPGILPEPGDGPDPSNGVPTAPKRGPTSRR